MIDLRSAVAAALLAVFAAPALAHEADAPIVTNSKAADSLSAEAAATPVAAADVISTPAAPRGPPMTTEQKIANALSGSWSADETDEPEVRGPRKIHGGGSVAVGSDGYRAASVYGVFPVGEKGTLGVAYSQAQGGRGVYAHGLGGFGGAPYGGFGVGRNGMSRSLALSYSFDADRAGSRDCRPASPDGSRPAESLWAGEMRGQPACAMAQE